MMALLILFLTFGATVAELDWRCSDCSLPLSSVGGYCPAGFKFVNGFNGKYCCPAKTEIKRSSCDCPAGCTCFGDNGCACEARVACPPEGVSWGISYCPSGYLCGAGDICHLTPPSSCPNGAAPCGSTCCPDTFHCGLGHECYVNVTSPECPSGGIPCYGKCCSDGYHCSTAGQTCYLNEPIPAVCPGEHSPCGKGCCPTGFVCDLTETRCYTGK